MSQDAVHENLTRVLLTNTEAMDSLVKDKLPSLIRRLQDLEIWDEGLAKSLVPKIQSYQGDKLHRTAVFYLASVMAVAEAGQFQKELESAVSIVTKERTRHKMDFYYDDAAIILGEQSGKAHQALVDVTNQALDAKRLDWTKINNLSPASTLKVKLYAEDTIAFAKYLLAVSRAEGQSLHEVTGVKSDFLFGTLKFPEALEFFAKNMPSIAWRCERKPDSSPLDYYLYDASRLWGTNTFNTSELVPIIQEYAEKLSFAARKIALQIVCSLEDSFSSDGVENDFQKDLSKIATSLIKFSDSLLEAQILIRIARYTLRSEDRFPLLISFNDPTITLAMITNDPNYWKPESRKINCDLNQLKPLNASIIRLAFFRSKAKDQDYQNVIQEIASTENSEIFRTLIQLVVTPETSDQVGKILMERRYHRRDKMAPHAFNFLPLTKSRWVLSELSKECAKRSDKIKELRDLEHPGHGLKIRETELRKVTDMAESLWRAIYPKGKRPGFLDKW